MNFRINSAPIVPGKTPEILQRSIRHLDALKPGELLTSHALSAAIGFSRSHFQDYSSQIPAAYKVRAAQSYLYGHPKTIAAYQIELQRQRTTVG